MTARVTRPANDDDPLRAVRGMRNGPLLSLALWALAIWFVL